MPVEDSERIERDDAEELAPLWEEEEDELDYEPGKAGAGLVAYLALGFSVLAILLIFFLPGTRGLDDKEAVTGKTRLQVLEEKVTQTEYLKDEVEQLLGELGEFGEAFSKRFAKLEKEMQALKKRVKERGENEIKAANSRAPQKTGETLYHTVSRGETLYGISRKYEVSVRRLVQLNELDVNRPIYVGQRILISGSGSDEQ
jgi:LysM repeat protein